MLSLLKEWLARKELAQLEYIKGQLQEYRRWLAEFPMIGLTLENLILTINGKDSLDACHPPFPTGPWTVDNLRYKLREMRACKEKGEHALSGLQNYTHPPGMDEDWRKEFDKKHEAMVAAQTRVAELEAKLVEATEVLVAKNREVNTLRLVCGEAYQVVAAQENPNIKALEGLYAASAGEPIPHMEFHE